MLAIGAWVGSGAALFVLLAVVVWGAVLALGHTLRHRQGTQLMGRLYLTVMQGLSVFACRSAGRIAPENEELRVRQGIAFAPAVLLGVCTTLVGMQLWTV